MEGNTLDLLDHLELINWIHKESYQVAGIGKEVEITPTLPSGKRVRITIKVEEYKE